MAETAQQIETRLRATYPTMTETVNGVERTLMTPEYDAKMAEWVAAELARQQEADDAASKKALRRQVRLALATLTTDLATLGGSPTQAQVRTIVQHNCQILQGLIQTLIDLRLVERTD